MKIILYMIMCSAVSQQCMPPYEHTVLNNHYDCMLAGYEEANRKTQEIGKEEVIKHGIYIKFACIEQIVKKEKDA